MLLNERRNDGDFRSSGGNQDSLDKSIHQSHAVELPGGKVLVEVGQHALCRRLLVFDPDWLLEAERSDDLAQGLGGWSVQQYQTSWAGNFRGITGHCAFNRCAGARLVPDPAGKPREVLHIARYPDTRLVFEPQGAVWNFPAGQTGEIHLELRLPTGSHGVRICLVNRWFNPVDPVVNTFSQVVVPIDRAGRIDLLPALAFDTWQQFDIRWDCRTKLAHWRVNDGEWQLLPYGEPCQDGISYLHIQSAAESSDLGGILLGGVQAKVGNPTSWARQ